MAWPIWPKKTVEYHDTPQGILTESGVWYKTTVQHLNEYAKELFEREPLEVQLALADTWIRTPHTLSLWLLPLGILYYDPSQWGIIVVSFFLIWQIIAPALVNRSLSPLIKLLDAAVMQSILYASTMSILAMSGQYYATMIGLLGFILFRWGVLSYLTRPIVIRCWESMYKLPAADHVLRAFIIRGALHYGITLSDFEDIEQKITQHISKKKSSQSSKK